LAGLWRAKTGYAEYSGYCYGIYDLRVSVPDDRWLDVEVWSDKPLVGGAGDGGVDGIIDQDHLGLNRIYVQAKRYAEGNTVGSGAIRVSSAV
jgi:restriction endonuclease Mrr